MSKTILLTGATDGIGYETAKILASQGHQLLLHGRSAEKLDRLKASLSTNGTVQTHRADLSRLTNVRALADTALSEHKHIDVLINNAGVYKTSHPNTLEGLDVRFIVNTVAPYVLTRRLLTAMPPQGRVINLSSAAQAPLELRALRGERALSDDEAYAQSKLAITMWSFHMARELADSGPSVMAVNPGSLLGSKMVREAFGTSGKDLGIGADILVRTALSDEFAGVSGRYYDNDRRALGNPHPDAQSAAKTKALIEAMESLITKLESMPGA
ncbi:MAG: SDR family NAD(P)-dependent oxidoreductase [Pseudomonadota bacterium]